jgi:hypothetical protein
MWPPLCHPSLGTAPRSVLLTMMKTRSTNCHPLLQEESPVMKSIRSEISIKFCVHHQYFLSADRYSYPQVIYFLIAKDGIYIVELKSVNSDNYT